MTGYGQTVWWRQCFVEVYKAGEPILKHVTSYGQATIPIGFDLFIGGKDGKVKL